MDEKELQRKLDEWQEGFSHFLSSNLELMQKIVAEAKREERERIFAILQDYGVGDRTQGIPWLDFNSKYGVAEESSSSLIDILRQALQTDQQ